MRDLEVINRFRKMQSKRLNRRNGILKHPTAPEAVSNYHRHIKGELFMS